MNRARVAGILEEDPVLSTAPTGEPTVAMRISVPGMARSEPGSIAVRQYGERAIATAEEMREGSAALVSGRLSHMTLSNGAMKDQHYEVVGRVDELPVTAEGAPLLVANQVEFTGRLTRDPELRSTPSGTSLCRMRIAVDGMGSSGRDSTGYVDVTEWGNQGEASARRLSKGWLVAVEGRLDHQVWETDGRSRETHSVVGRVEHLAPPRAAGDRDRELGSGQEQGVDPREPGAATRSPGPGVPAAVTEQTMASVGAEDDIPF
jgi:single-strand DNA-binding protein